MTVPLLVVLLEDEELLVDELVLDDPPLPPSGCEGLSGRQSPQLSPYSSQVWSPRTGLPLACPRTQACVLPAWQITGACFSRQPGMMARRAVSARPRSAERCMMALSR
jgi:hypothetical protein